MTLEQLMACSVADDHARQEQVWELLAHSYNKSASYIRQKLTEDTVRVADKRVRFVTVDAYIASGGGVMRDLFEHDDGGWLTDPALLDRLVDEKLAADGERNGAAGWKWVAAAVEQIGSGSGREGWGQKGSVWVGAGELKKKRITRKQ